MSNLSKIIVISTALSLSLLAGVAEAKSFSRLAKEGYSLGKLTKGQSGSLGWVASKGAERFFCRLNVASAYDGPEGMVGITASGRLIPMNRAVYDDALGGPDPSKPQWRDLQAGRVRASDVGSCTPMR